MYGMHKIAAWAFALVVLTISAAVLLSAGAAAQTGGNSTVERIDSNTVIVNSSYSEQTGVATVVIESDIPQRIVVTDAGGFNVGGQIERRSVTATPGDRTEISLPVTKVNGRVGLGIETQQTLYGHIIEVPNHLFYSDPGWGTVRLVGFGSGLGVLAAVVLEVFRRKFWKKKHVRKIA